MISDCGEILSRNPTFLDLLKRTDVVTLSAARRANRITIERSRRLAAHIGADMKSAEDIGLGDTSKVVMPAGSQCNKPSMSSRRDRALAWANCDGNTSAPRWMSGERWPRERASQADAPHDQHRIAEP
jgi:hypothetical protein